MYNSVSYACNEAKDNDRELCNSGLEVLLTLYECSEFLLQELDDIRCLLVVVFDFHFDFFFVLLLLCEVCIFENFNNKIFDFQEK